MLIEQKLLDLLNSRRTLCIINVDNNIIKYNYLIEIVRGELIMLYFN